jgi:hypothetical protein
MSTKQPRETGPQEALCAPSSIEVVQKALWIGVAATCERGNGAVTDSNMPFADCRKAIGGIQEAAATGKPTQTRHGRLWALRVVTGHVGLDPPHDSQARSWF